jgi:L-lactate dehydrogenase complex protein LldG
MEAVRGCAFTDGRSLGAWLLERGATRGYCDPALLTPVRDALGAFADRLTLDTDLDRARIDDYQFGVTRAAGAIAETGSLILDDNTTSRRLGALAPWIHVAVLTPTQIHPHVAAAIAALNDDPYIIFCTGPSKTADVEGILIEGVHGPGEQAALILPRL